VRRLLEAGRASAAGAVLRRKGERVAAGARIRVALHRAAAERAPVPEPGRPLTVLARGSGWIAVDKPAGMPVHPLREDETGSVLSALVARHPEMLGVGEAGLRSGVVHRLDVETSGVLLFATEEAAWQRLREAFRRHRVEKLYRAIVLGTLAGEADVTLDLVTARHRPARVRAVAPGERSRHGRPRRARLHWRSLETLGMATLVEVRPVTGFQHQIRVTLAHLGHPVAGDRTYGPGPASDPTAAPRLLLHAARLVFQDVDVASPDPPDFAATLAALRRGVG
jgi:23S rRNA pseudouridine1911/1915/1917 synthase